MSTANVVPETYGLGGADAREVLGRAGFRRVALDSAIRFRWADGFSHARALAFQMVLTLMPGVIVLMGVATLTHRSSVRDAVLGSIRSFAPGPAGQVFESAADQGVTSATASSGWRPLVVGAVAMLISAATTFGQIERGANRIYGVERDRPSRQKYGRATVMALTAGAGLSGAFVLLAVGHSVGESLDSHRGETAWNLARWPAGAVLLVAGYAVIFRSSPRRHQPPASWLTVGACIAAAATLLVSVALAAYLNLSSSFGDTYGPVAGFMGIMLWAYLTSIALLFGLAFAAQLEAVRAGEPEPESEEKVEQVDRALAEVPT